MATLAVVVLVLIALGALTHLMPGLKPGRVGHAWRAHRPTERINANTPSGRKMRVSGSQCYPIPSSFVSD